MIEKTIQCIGVAMTTAGLGTVAMTLAGPAAVMAAAAVGIAAVALIPARNPAGTCGAPTRSRRPLVILGPGPGARRALMPDGRTLRS